MKKTLIKKLDKAWADKVKQPGQCEVCGQTNNLNAHHYYTRRNRAVRWYIPNGFCLCPNHHTFSSQFSAHQTPHDFCLWAVKKRGEDWIDDLIAKKNMIVKFYDVDFDMILDDINSNKG